MDKEPFSFLLEALKNSMKILESATIRELAIDAAFICHIFIFHKDRTIVNFRKKFCVVRILYSNRGFENELKA